MATLTGTAVIWGSSIEAATSTAIVIDSDTGQLQSASFTREADIADLRDQNNDVVGRAYYNHRKRMSLTVVPADTATPSVGDDTPAEAGTARYNQDQLLPAPGTKVVVADVNSTITDKDPGNSFGETLNTIAGLPYVVESASMRKSNQAMAVGTLELVAHDYADVSDTTT